LQKNRPKYVRNVFCGKVASNLGLLLYFLNGENTRTIGENSPNLVTLPAFDFQVCLATQTSVDRIFWLLNTTESWSGPISIAIFCPDVEYDVAVTFIAFLTECYPKIRQQVSILRMVNSGRILGKIIT
jgi:hypothetical protein